MYDVFFPKGQPCACPDDDACHTRKTPSNAWEVVFNKVCVHDGYIAPTAADHVRPAFNRGTCAAPQLASDGRAGQASIGSQIGTPAYLGTVLPLAAVVVVLATIAIRRRRSVVIRQFALQEDGASGASTEV